MSQQPILTNFTSDIDKFLQTFDQAHPKPSQSQQKEIEKYHRIGYLRDVADHPEESTILWEGF